MAIMARFKSHNSTYNGDGSRQKGTLSINEAFY